MAEQAPRFRYDARLAGEIELRWQERWEREGTFHVPDRGEPGRPTFYLLDFFPYPSGIGLHVGHPLGYIGTDVFGRYLRMTGHHVLHPFGFDTFGLPAEQYAIDTGQHPQLTTEANVRAMRRQLRRLGLGHDERREVATTDPAFYRWTQWIFLQIYNSWVDERTGRARPIAELIDEFSSGQRAAPGEVPWGLLTAVERRRVVDGYRLAYLAEELVNWCPGLGTVLANEEVTADGRSDIGNYPVYRRPLRQWMLRITAFAERLVADLDTLDWPESIKQRQRNWIGASDGAYVTFPVVGSGESIEVFTTRPDTLTGATYMVLAPEHPLVEALIADGADEVRDAVRAYQERAARLSDRQRTGGGAAKTGVFIGRMVTNPATSQQIPIYLADYVLAGYGTGAIMAVPAHDQRDYDFAKAFDLPIRPVVAPRGLPGVGIFQPLSPLSWALVNTVLRSGATQQAGSETEGLAGTCAAAACCGGGIDRLFMAAA